MSSDQVSSIAATLTVDQPVILTYLSDNTPDEFKGWPDIDVIHFAKLIRARKQELDSELRRRGFYFAW